MRKFSVSYADAGVNLDAWKETRSRISDGIRSTFTPGVVGGFGHFGGLFSIADLKNYDDPILVSSVDGVGTKLKIAFETGRHDSVGEDIVNHCCNDILVLGARPLFFLDYIATGRLEPHVVERVVAGLVRACRENAIALIGGETAEMPDFYSRGEYDLAGTIVGAVDRRRVIDGSSIRPGDMVIGLRSNGLHTNGYSLARKIVRECAGRSWDDIFGQTGKTFGEELLRPHRSYLPLLEYLRNGMIAGCAHITGGGFQDNIDRILPRGCDARIDTRSWEPDPIFGFLRGEGNVEISEMYHTFNMGIGMALVVHPADADGLIGDAALARYSPRLIGEISEGEGRVRLEVDQ